MVIFSWAALAFVIIFIFIILLLFSTFKEAHAYLFSLVNDEVTGARLSRYNNYAKEQQRNI